MAKISIWGLILFCFFVLACDQSSSEKIQFSKKASEVILEKNKDSTENIVTIASILQNPTYYRQNKVRVTGKAIEISHSRQYTYLLLEDHTGKVWCSVYKTDLPIGADVSIHDAFALQDFESKGLQKKFNVILFGSLRISTQQNTTKTLSSSSTHKHEEKEIIQIEKAPGENSYTIAEIYDKLEKLKDKKIRVRGKVVKFLSQIMDINWLHLQDGSGETSKKNHDLTVTTLATVAVGDIVVVEGILSINKNLGAGYFYPALLENSIIVEKK